MRSRKMAEKFRENQKSLRRQPMGATLECKDDFLYVVEEKDVATGKAKKWLPVRMAGYGEAQTLQGQPVTSVNMDEGIYVDEEGNVYQLADKGETKPIAVEHLPEPDKTELEVLLAASLKGGQANGKSGGAKRPLKNNRSSTRRQQSSKAETPNCQSGPAETSSAVEGASTLN